MLNEQDKRAIETIAQCGFDVEVLCSMFSKASREEIEAIWKDANDNKPDASEGNSVSINCS